MFHNVLMTSLTPLRDTNEVHCWDNRPFNTSWPEKQEKVKDISIKKTIKKKNKRYRTMFTTEQVKELEKVFVRSKYIDVERRKEIAECLQMDQKCIKIWFQNRRMKEKKELSESCDSASEGIAESMSPPLEASQPLNYVEGSPNSQHPTDQSQLKPPQYNYYSENNYQNVRPIPYYYNSPNNYSNIEELKNQPSTYHPCNNTGSPECGDFVNIGVNESRNDTGYSISYYPPDPVFKYYYNMGYVYDNYATSHGQDWTVTNFNTNYL